MSRRHLLPCLALGFCLVCSPFVATQQPGKEQAAKDLAMMQGTWESAAYFYNEKGKEVAIQNPNAKNLLIVENDTIVVFPDNAHIKTDKNQIEGKITLNPAATPKEIDVITPAGNKRLGIYQVTGDELRVCLGSTKRPTTLEGGENFLVKVYKRVNDYKQTKEMEALQGKWEVTVEKTKGVEIPADPAKGIKMIAFENNKITFLLNGKAAGEATFTLNPGKSPKEIDLVSNKGKNLGIYELDGEELKLAFHQQAQRPNDFSGDKVEVISLKRFRSDELTGDLQRDHLGIQGKWEAVSFINKGSSVSVKDKGKITFIFYHDRLKIKQNDRVTNDVFFAINPAAFPKTIDIIDREKPVPGRLVKTTLGIYELKNNTLKISVGQQTSYPPKETRKPFLKQEKKLNSNNSWPVPVIAKAKGPIAFRIASQGPFTVQVMSEKLWKAIEANDRLDPPNKKDLSDLKEFNKKELFLTKEVAGTSYDGRVVLPAGSSYFVVKNNMDKRAELTLQCFEVEKEKGEKPFFDEKKQLDKDLEWHAEVNPPKRPGQIMLRVDSEGPFQLAAIKDNVWKAAKTKDLKSFAEVDVFRTFDVKEEDEEGGYNASSLLPPGVWHFIVKNQSNKKEELRLQCLLEKSKEKDKDGRPLGFYKDSRELGYMTFKRVKLERGDLFGVRPDIIDKKPDRFQFTQIAAAMHYYYDANQKFPAASIRGPKGPPLLSWRVALLPYLDMNDLYKEFKLNEPWDSKHNKKLLRKMPEIYKLPCAPFDPEEGETCFRVLVGGGAGFEWSTGLTAKDFTNGLAKTIMLVEAAEPVPWTKPEELEYDPTKPLPKFGNHYTNGTFVAAFFDGSVRVLSETIPEPEWWGMIARNQHESVVVVKLTAAGEMANALESVKDQASAKTAATRMEEIVGRLEILRNKAQSLPPLKAEEEQNLKKKYEVQRQAATDRLIRVSMQAEAAAQGEPAFTAALKKYTALN